MKYKFLYWHCWVLKLLIWPRRCSLIRQNDVTLWCCCCSPALHVFPLKDSNICVRHKHGASGCQSCTQPSFRLWQRFWDLQREALASYLAASVGMINVTNHLLTLRGQAFSLSPPLPPAVFYLPLHPVDQLYLVQTILCPLQIPGNTTMHFPCLQSSVRLTDLSFWKYLLCCLWNSFICYCE